MPFILLAWVTHILLKSYRVLMNRKHGLETEKRRMIYIISVKSDISEKQENWCRMQVNSCLPAV